MCLRAYVLGCLAHLRAWRAYVLGVLACLTCLHASLLGVLLCLRALRAYVLAMMKYFTFLPVCMLDVLSIGVLTFCLFTFFCINQGFGIKRKPLIHVNLSQLVSI